MPAESSTPAGVTLSLANRTALITGGSRGIGAATAHRANPWLCRESKRQRRALYQPGAQPQVMAHHKSKG